MQQDATLKNKHFRGMYHLHHQGKKSVEQETGLRHQLGYQLHGVERVRGRGVVSSSHWLTVVSHLANWANQ
jgi:hypothetical protein